MKLKGKAVLAGLLSAMLLLYTAAGCAQTQDTSSSAVSEVSTEKPLTVEYTEEDRLERIRFHIHHTQREYRYSYRQRRYGKGQYGYDFCRRNLCAQRYTDGRADRGQRGERGFGSFGAEWCNALQFHERAD